MLGLYDLSSEKIGTLIDTFDNYNVDLKLKIPNTVLKEFNKNFENMKYTSDNDIIESIKNIKETLKEMKKKLRNLNIWNEQKEDYTNILDAILSYEENIREEYYPNGITNISKLTLIDELVNKIMINADVLEDIDERTKITWMTEGFARTHYNYPPGYEDQAKFQNVKKEFHSKKEHPRPSDLDSHLSDFYIWKEILSDSRKTSKIFITNDLKKDWWEIPSEETSLTEYKPRKELIREYNSFSSEFTEINFIPFDLFINYFLIHYNEDFNQELLYDLITINYEPYMVECGQDWILDGTGNVSNIIEPDILMDYEYNKGLAVKDWEIILNYAELDYIDFDTDFDIMIDNPEDNTYKFHFTLYYEVEGEYDLSLGLEDTVFDGASGDFKIDSLAIECELTVKIPFITDKNQIKSENIFDDIDIIDINFEFISNSTPRIISQNDPWDDYYESQWRD